MKKLKLIIKERGRYVDIPGLATFRTPAEVDVTKVKISILLQSLHSCGVDDYELISISESGGVLKKWNKDNMPKKETPVKNDKLEKQLDKLERLEGMMLKLLSNKPDKRNNNSEQIKNRLSRIERMLSSKGTIVQFTDKKTAVIEEMEDQFIPKIDVSEMKISGKSTETLEKTSSKEIDDTVDLLSRLTKNGGK